MKPTLIIEIQLAEYQKLVGDANYYEEYFESYLLEEKILDIADYDYFTSLVLFVYDGCNLVSTVNLEATRQIGHYLTNEAKKRLGLPVGVDLWEWFNCYSQEWRMANA